MKKKILSIVLSTVMLMSLLAGCEMSSTGKTAQSTSGTETTKSESTRETEVEKITMYTPFVGNNEDKQQIMDAINEITIAEIGVEVDWQQYDIGQWFQQYSMFLSGSDKVDILFNFGGIATGMGQGSFMQMDELLDENGQGIKDVLGEYIVSGEVSGKMYGLVPYGLYASSVGILYRADIVRELGLEDEVSNVKSVEEWGTILAAVKEEYPEMTPYVTVAGSSMPNLYYGNWDSLSNHMGVLMNEGQGTSVVDLFETEDYAKLCRVFSDWYNLGYTNKDIQTVTDSYSTLCAQGTAFSTWSSLDETTAFTTSASTGHEIGAISLGESFAPTYTNGAYTIMANSEHPVAAMKFLNMMYTNQKVINLMSWGIEGVHYQVLEDGTLDYIDGQDMNSCTYHDQLGLCSNKALRTEWVTEYPGMAKLIEENNESCLQSKAMGFVFDSTSVLNQTTEIDNVLTKYRLGIESGAMDVEETLPIFISELKAAGIDEVVAEKQRQLDEWLNNK